MREVLEHLCAHAKTSSRVKSVPMMPAVWFMNGTSALGLSPLGPYHALMYGRSLYFDISKAQKELDCTCVLYGVHQFLHLSFVQHFHDQQ